MKESVEQFRDKAESLEKELQEKVKPLSVN